MKTRFIGILSFVLLIPITAVPGQGRDAAPARPLKYDHNYTFSEVRSFLKTVSVDMPKLTTLHTIGKSFLGKDLLVLEITNKSTGGALKKPGFWMDGNLHSSEVFGCAVCLNTIETLLSGYGHDEEITRLLDTNAIYIMPKLNPDGSDYYLTHPDGLRSSVRPHDSDRDGSFDEDPPDDLNQDGNITQMRIKDPLGTMRSDPEEPRLMVRRKEDETGEWRVLTEGVDNDHDGLFNEDGIGGLDINRNWPAQWQQEYIQNGAGPFPLSEPETRAVAEFLFSHRNVTGIINHHMAGNFLYRPPNNRHFNPATGIEEPMPVEDSTVYSLFGKKYSEIINDQKVQIVYGRGGPPRYGAIWGVMIGWAYDHYGAFSFVPEIGQYPCDYDEDGKVTQAERLRWNDTEMGGEIFVDWQPYDHPQLGKVEIGGFLSKIYNPKSESYINLMCHPGPVYRDFLKKHTAWNLYLASMSPRVQITSAERTSLGKGLTRIKISVQNQGFLPSHVTHQALRNQTAKTVKARLQVNDAELVIGRPETDVGHLPGNTPQSVSPIKTVEWVVKNAGDNPRVTVEVFSEKGGTETRTFRLD